MAINYLSRLINTKMRFSNGSQTYQISRKTAVRRHKMVALKIGIGFKYKLYHIFLMCDCWNSYRQLMHEHTWIQKMFACAKLAVKQTWCQWKYFHLFNTFFYLKLRSNKWKYYLETWSHQTPMSPLDNGSLGQAGLW